MKDPGSRILELDALRGLAAVAVMLFHYTSRFQRLYGFEEAMPFEFWYGRMGVELFFMISGFVIFMTLERTHTGMDFVVSRFSRLFPVFWVAILVTFSSTLFCSLPGREVQFYDAILNLTMVPRFFAAPMVDGVYWSLEKELLFYLAMFMLFKFSLLHYVRQAFALWLITALTLPILAHFCGFDQSIFFKVTKEFLLLRHISFFSFGIVFYGRLMRGRFDHWDAIIITLAMSRVSVFYSFDEIILVFIYLLIFTLLIYSRLGFLSHPVFIFLGAISYSLYLIHQNIGYIVIRAVDSLTGSPYAAVLAAIVVSLILASALTFLIERPAIRWIRKGYRGIRSQLQGREALSNG